MDQMSVFQCIQMAIIEGLTEFLPISSTAHMKFAGPFIGITQRTEFQNLFEVVIQFGAILAVLVFFRKKFFSIRNPSFYIKLMVALLPSVVAAILLKPFINMVKDNLIFIAWVMLLGGIVLLFIEKIFSNLSIDKEEKITYKTSFLIGCGQVLAILFPGLSRSAATILSGMSLKLTRSMAAEFSFFLAVPTMFAASSKSLLDTYQDHPEVMVSSNFSLLILGSIIAFIVSMIAIKFFINFVKKFGFTIWGIYRVVVGTCMLILLYTKTIQ